MRNSTGLRSMPFTSFARPPLCNDIRLVETYPDSRDRWRSLLTKCTTSHANPKVNRRGNEQKLWAGLSRRNHTYSIAKSVSKRSPGGLDKLFCYDPPVTANGPFHLKAARVASEERKLVTDAYDHLEVSRIAEVTLDECHRLDRCLPRRLAAERLIHSTAGLNRRCYANSGLFRRLVKTPVQLLVARSFQLRRNGSE